MIFKDGGQQSREEIQLAAFNEQKYILTERCNKFEATRLSIEDELKENTAALQDIRLKQQEADKALKELEQSEANDSEWVNVQGESVVGPLILRKMSMSMQLKKFLNAYLRIKT